RFCSVCGASLTTAATGAVVSPAITYALVTTTAFLTLGLAVLGVFYLAGRQNADVAAAAPVASPTVSPTATPSPTPTPKAMPTPTPDDLEAYLDPPEPLPTPREKVTPLPEPSVSTTRERTVASPTPCRVTYPESLVDASDVLVRDSRIYRFHLSQPARA